MNTESTGTKSALIVTAVGTTVAALLALIGVLAQGKFLLELASQLAVHGDQLLAGTDKGLTRSDAAVRLNSDHDLWHVRMGDCMFC